MTPFQIQRQDWPGDSAVLLVHGIGNAAPGDYEDIASAVRTALGGKAAVYSLFYDVFNDWFMEKTQLAPQIKKVTSFLKSKQSGDEVADTIAEFAGDVIWPIFSLKARTTVKTAYIAQLRQMLHDGRRSTGKPVRELKVSIVCHSLGCFHTYEVLHTLATDAMLSLRPVTEGVRFRAVVYMASPVQLIRTVTESISGLVPGNLACAHATGLAMPSETALGATLKSARRFVSITGDMDPIGGHFIRTQVPWAYMNIPDPDSTAIVDPQTVAGTGNERVDLRTVLRNSLTATQPPRIRPHNPHSWMGYVERHQGALAGWFA